MDSLATYCATFEREISRAEPALLAEFVRLREDGNPRSLFLWLEELRSLGRLPEALEDVLTRFYWEHL